MSITSTNFTQPKTGFVIGISGGGVKVSPSSGMTVAISSGFYFLGGKQSFYAGGTKAISAAHASLTRYDVMGIDTNGTIIVKEGTPDASPSVPIARDDLLLLAVITVTGGDATIAAADITDVRNIGGVSADGTTVSVSASGVISVLEAGLTSIIKPLASGEGSTTIVGNGSGQNVFTDTFTAASDGDMVFGVVRWRMNRDSGVDTPDADLKLGSTSIRVRTGIADDAQEFSRFTYSKGTGTNRGFGIVETIVDTGTGTAAHNITTNNLDAWANAISGLTLSFDPAAATTITVYYNYCVFKIPTGV